MPSPIDLTPYWCRHRGTPKDLRQAQEISSDVSAYQAFPTFFVLSEQASSSHRRVELRVAVKMEGMVQRILQVDVNAARFSVLSYPQRNVLDSFEISHLVQADFPDELVIRLGFRQSIPGWISTRIAALSGQTTSKSKKEQIWTRTFHTMSSSQRDYIGALLQGLVGLIRPLNLNRQLLCSPTLLRVGREQLTMWMGSWNMGNKPVSEFTPTKRGVSPSVRPWLILDERDFDIYVAGLQEMDTSVFPCLDQQLGPEYYQVARVTMGAIGLAVFIRKRLLPHVKSVETVTSAAGFAGVGTNKGFVCAAMTIYEQPLLFICCHLAARDDATRLKQRIHQYKLASRRLKLGRLPGTDPFHQFTTFFFGDMNFRVCTIDREAWPNAGRTRKEVVDNLYNANSPESYEKAIEFAFEGDQLKIEKERGAIFDQFKEFPINFSPTYKYLSFPKSASWESVKDSKGVIVGHQARDVEATPYSQKRALEDLGSDGDAKVSGYYMSARDNAQRREYTEHKSQVPSWCDRILHRALPPVRVEQTSYKAVDDILTSDHSPVYGTFTLELPQTSSSVPNAAFHVCSIQILRVEVYSFRHPGTPVHNFATEAAGRGGGGRDDDDDDDEDEMTIRAKSDAHALLDRKNSEDSEIEIYSVKDNDGENGPHLKQLVCAAVMPFMRETSTRSRVTSKPTMALTEAHGWKPNCKLEPDDTPEFIFTGKNLQGMAVGPFLTTREHLQSQWFVLHFLPKVFSETRESAAACVIPLAEAADGRSVNFEAKLQHNGQPSGFVRGKFRVWLDADGWDEEYVQNPASHMLNPKKLTKNFNASAHVAARRKSPAPPISTIIGDVEIKVSLPKLVSGPLDEEDIAEEELVRRIHLADSTFAMEDESTKIDDDDDDDDDEDPFARLARENTIKNASTEVTGFRKFEPRVTKKKLLLQQMMTSEGSKKEKKKGLLGIGGSTRRLTIGWGSGKD